MLRNISRSLIAIAVLAATGCSTIHEDSCPTCPPPDKTIGVRVETQVNVSPISISTPDVDERTLADEYDIRHTLYVTALTGENAGDVVLRETASNGFEPGQDNIALFDITLGMEKYNISTWVDYVPKSVPEDHRYDTSDPSDVTYTTPYTGYADDKNAYSGSQTVDLSNYSRGKELTIGLDAVHAHGKFEVISTDVGDYILGKRAKKSQAVTTSGLSSLNVKVSYTGLYPMSYDLAAAHAPFGGYKGGVSFTGNVIPLEDGTALLAFDYVFITKNNTANISANIEITADNGQVVNRIENLRIELTRGRLMAIRGEFLTKDFDGGGIGIDDSFDGDNNIQI